MKILLLHPPMDSNIQALRRTEGMGMGYITAVLRSDGHEVEMLDAFLRRMNIRETIAEVKNRNFDCLGITAYDVHKQNVITLAKEIRKQKKNVLITVGGYLPTFTAEKLLQAAPEIDFLVRGEGETTAIEVFRKISKGEDWRDTPGIAYLKDGAPVLNPLPPLIENLDSLPFPARDERKKAGDGPALIVGSRGCNHRCSFCAIPSFYALSGGKLPRHRSPSNIIDEMEHVIAETGIREFVFADDNFIGPGSKNRERVEQFVRELRQRKLEVTFTIEARVDEIDEDILRQLKEVGLTRVFMGVESGVQRQLDTYKKGVTVEQNKRAIELVQKLGLNYYIGMIFLDPYVTLSELAENIEFARKYKLPDGKNSLLIATSKLTLYGGVPIIEQLRKEGLLRERGMDLDYVYKDPVFRCVNGIVNLISAPFRFFNRICSRS